MSISAGVITGPIAVPLLAGVAALLLRRNSGLAAALLVLATVINLTLAVSLFGTDQSLLVPWDGFGFQIILRVYHFSGFIVLAAAGFGVLVGLYCLAFLQRHPAAGTFYAYFLLTLAFTNGAVLADNLVLLLFFWEGLLLLLFGMIYVGHRNAYRTAIKAFIITGVTDLCMMLGIGVTIFLANTAQISAIALPATGIGSLALVLLAVGAVSKAGSMPFHSWIPDAAVDAPLPFMALVPAALEKLLGIYFLARITLDLFALEPGSWVSTLLMIVGALTILLAVLMALIQRDYKRLLSFHAISQVGYMILGIGTAVPAGIVGGIFHMINHAMYKCCLFLTGGAVERQTGTTDLEKLGGLGRSMPWTCASFIVAAAAISGVPPFNGFFSKELVYDGALERGWIYYAAALLGSFLTAASFLKLGHAAYFGRPNPELKAKEAPLSMLIPMLALAGLCVLFGVYNALPLRHLIQPILGVRISGHDFSGWPESWLLLAGTVIVLLAAWANHRYGVRRTGSGVKAADHIHYAPVLHSLYDRAERKQFDPYEIGLQAAKLFGKAAFGLDRLNDWIYNYVVPESVERCSRFVRMLHNGRHATYLIWSLAGLLLVLRFMLRG